MIEILGIKYLTEKEASVRYGLSQSWFALRRFKKDSPPYTQLQKKGKVLYPLTEVDEWFKKNMTREEV